MKKLNTKADDKLTKLYLQMDEIASLEVERIARKILREHPKYHEFIMAMGTYNFLDKNRNETSPMESIYNPNNGTYLYKDTFEYFKPLNDFMLRWENILKISGEGMRFTATGEKITDW